MKPHCKTLAAVLLGVAITVASPVPILSQRGEDYDDPGLSTYWKFVVTRWERIIVRYAEERRLDPDLVAAVVWKESLGDSTARGPTGAVGLMGLKPFEWRPSPEELENPWLNVFWGARALAHTIRDGRGDLFYSLAAYNGGWDKIHRSTTRGYATDVLGHYARAVAVRHGLSPEGKWVAVIAVEGTGGSNTVTVLGPQRPLARYTRRPWLKADIPSVPDSCAPHTTVITFVSEGGVECRVNLWLVTEDGHVVSPCIAQRSSQPVLSLFSVTQGIP